MAKRVGVFIDVSNLYYCIDKKFDGRKLDYKKYMDFISELGDIICANAYGAQIRNEANKFIYFLKSVGFNTKWKKPKFYVNRNDGQVQYRHKADWDVGIAVDIIKASDRIDILILGSADGDLKPLVEYMTSKSIEVVIFATKISRELKGCSTKYIEIPESLLETRKEIKNDSQEDGDRTELSPDVPVDDPGNPV